MTTKIRLQSGVALSAIATAALGLWLAGTVTPARAQQDAGAPAGATEVAVDADDIGGIVSGSGGPEAGVWVIAETTDLPTKFAKIVVTDDAGRYVVPDLPKAKYKVWVRGYGLVDLPKVDGEPGTAPQSHGRKGTERRRSRAVLSRHLLVRDAENSGSEPVRR